MKRQMPDSLYFQLRAPAQPNAPSPAVTTRQLTQLEVQLEAVRGRGRSAKSGGLTASAPASSRPSLLFFSPRRSPGVGPDRMPSGRSRRVDGRAHGPVDHFHLRKWSKKLVQEKWSRGGSGGASRQPTGGCQRLQTPLQWLEPSVSFMTQWRRHRTRRMQLQLARRGSGSPTEAPQP